MNVKQLYSNHWTKSSLTGYNKDELINRTNDQAYENELQMKPNKSKWIKQQIKHELSTKTYNKTDTNRIRIERYNINNNNAF